MSIWKWAETHFNSSEVFQPGYSIIPVLNMPHLRMADMLQEQCIFDIVIPLFNVRQTINISSILSIQQ